ncbi:MAG: hypothetical protein KBC11_01530 [Candidatus Pacebacteria bacterium]|nr:hypothetical protein [Candidatus Paceibacterota bacterium]
MIHITQDQNVFESENLKVATLTGDYEDGTLIEFYDVDSPNIISGTFQAQYIKYGGLVYKFSGHKELGEEILKIDPTSTHTAASYVRMTNELLAQMDNGELEPGSLDEAIVTEQEKMEEKKINPDEQKEEIEETIEEAAEEEENIPEETIKEEVLPEEEVPTEGIQPEQEVFLTPVEEIVPEVIPEEQAVSMLNRKTKRKFG